MPMANNQTQDLQVLGVNHERSNVWFLPNGGSSPVSFGGHGVLSVARTGVGTYLVTLQDFSPKAMVSCECYGFDNANPTDTAVRVGLVTITPATRRVTLVVYVSSALAAGPALKDVAANAASIVKLGLHWKCFSGKDASGL